MLAWCCCRLHRGGSFSNHGRQQWYAGCCNNTAGQESVAMRPGDSWWVRAPDVARIRVTLVQTWYRRHSNFAPPILLHHRLAGTMHRYNLQQPRYSSNCWWHYMDIATTCTIYSCHWTCPSLCDNGSNVDCGGHLQWYRTLLMKSAVYLKLVGGWAYRSICKQRTPTYAPLQPTMWRSSMTRYIYTLVKSRGNHVIHACGASSLNSNAVLELHHVRMGKL